MKKFKHNKIEQCKISGKSIDTQKERYCIILDCNGDQIETVGFYKTDILKDLLKNNGDRIANQVTNNVMDKAGEILQNMGLVKPTYEVGL